MSLPSLVGVIGATATGKSDVALAIARAFEGEIIGADAYQVYEGLDIGTAKPSRDDRDAVLHHLVDSVPADRQFTLASYLDSALSALDDVWGRGRLPVVCGGSGQYFWALIEGWQVPRVGPDGELREELETLAASEGVDVLYERLAAIDPDGASRLDRRNVRRVVRALELVERTGLPLSACQTRDPLPADKLIIGMSCPRDELHARVDARVEAMFSAGLVDEVEALRAEGYGDARPVRSAIGYAQVSDYLDGMIALDAAIERTKTATHRLVRAQGAWFKAADPRVTWIPAGPGAPESAAEAVKVWLHARSEQSGAA